MDVLHLLARLFGRAWGCECGDSAESAGSRTGLLDRPADHASVGAEPEGWWIPDAETTVLAPPPAPRGSLIDGDLYDQLVRVLEDPTLELPRMPQVAQRALFMLHDPRVDFQRLADVIRQDPATAAEVIRVANSVAYRGIREVARLDLAFARLGCRALRSIILSISVKGLAIRTGGSQRSRSEELWQRALVSGIVVEQFSDPQSLPKDEALLVGLLHDIGMLAVFRVLHDYQRTRGCNVPRPLFDRLCDEWHEHVGLRLADAWNLPDPLPDIIGSHHREVRDDDPLQHHRTLTQFADVVCAMLGYAPYVPYDFFALPCARRLGLDNNPPTWERLAGLPEVIAEQIEGW